MGHPPRLSGTVLACLLLLTAGVESTGKCTTGCRGMQGSKAYKEGTTYVYDLEGTLTTSVSDGQNSEPVELTATVEMSVKPDCLHQLRLKDVKLNKAPPSTPDVEQYAVQFNYHDGHIDTELCTEPGDSQASLNIKRAVVSMFQSAVMKESGSATHHETDVMGACPTKFYFRKDADTLIVHKTKNLDDCAYRENVNQGLISASADMAAGVKSSPLMSSTQELEQHFERGVLKKTWSADIYKLKPFKNGDSGARTDVRTRLTLKSEKPDSPAAAVSVPKSLVFEAPHPVLKSSADALSNALKAAKAEVVGGMKQEAAGKFSELTKIVRQSSKDDILSVYKKARAGGSKEEQKLLLDALCRAGTGEAAEVVVELIKNKEVSGIQELMFYGGLALIGHVHLPSMVAITSLLNQPNLPRIGYLGVGHVIGKHCQDHPCENVPQVKEALHKIREKVGNGKAKTREQENLVVSALKALGNTRFLDDATLQKIANIAADKNVRNRVRVAAIEALPARCSMKWKNILFKVLGDLEEDSEIRIKSYLSMVACPCEHVAATLKEVLSKETVNQVGSFIQSHLRNLRASTDPNKQSAKVQLGLIKPRTMFPEDFRKFSFNTEVSYNAEALGLGSTLESNVIYSQNSFVPRSANLNLTTEIFGRSFNFLNLNARVENLDRVIEHYLGPKGKLREKDVDDMKESASTAAADIEKQIKDRYSRLGRGKRDVKQGELDRFAKNVHLRGNEVDQNLDLDLSLELFGVELGYLQYQGDSSKLKTKMIVDKFFDCLDKGVDMAKYMNYDLENYVQFLEAELVYPTGMGFALTLGLTGTSAARMKINGKIDIPAFLSDAGNGAAKVALEPSASISVVGSMVVQGLGAESGMKIVNTLHTATSTDVILTMLDGKGVDIKVGVPKKKQELINMKSEVLVSGPKPNTYVAAKFDKGKEYKDCFDQLSPLIGITVCGKISYPYEDIATIHKKPMFPLSGPAEFAVTVENNDVSNYHFKVYLDANNPKKRTFEILLDTPKSKTNRHVSLVAEVGLESPKYAKISFDSPVKKASVEAVLANNPQERSLTLTANHDQNQYYGKIGVIASGSKYKPVLEYKMPDHIEKLASSKVGLAPGQQYNVQGTVDVTDYEGGQKFVFDKVTLMANGQKLLVIDGSTTWTPTVLNVDTDLGYGDKNLALKVNGERDEKGCMLVISALPSTDPNIAFKFKWEVKREPGQMKNTVTFVHGPDPNSKRNRLALTQSARFNFDPKNFDLDLANDLSYPVVKLNAKVDLNLAVNSKSKNTFGTNILVEYDKFKLGTELSAKVNENKKGDYDVNGKAALMENEIRVHASRVVLDDHKSKFANALVLTPGGKYTADATVTYDVTKNNVNVQLDGDANLNGKKVKVDSGLECNQQAINSRAFVKVDGVKYVEFLLNTRRSPHPTGNLNLNLKSYLTATGQYTYQNGKGNMNLNVDVPKINRKIKGNGDLTVSGTQHVGNFELLYDAEKDPSKRVKLSTVSDINKNSIDTKNVLEVLDNKLELNGKGSLKGTLTNGELQVEGDMTLPNGRHFVLKGNRNSVKKENKYDVQVDAELADYAKKGGEARKLTYNIVAKDVDLQAYTFQTDAKLKYVGVDGKDVQVAWKGKKLKDDEKKVNNVNVEVSGAKVPKKFQFQLGSSCDEDETTYDVKSSLGDNLSLKSKGKMKQGNDEKPCKVEGILDVKLPSDKLENLKLEVSGSMLGPNTHRNEMESESSVTLTYNGDKTVKMESELKLKEMNELDEKSEGKWKFNVNVLQFPQLKTGGSYKYSLSEEKRTGSADLNVNYGDKELKLKTSADDVPEMITVNLEAKCNLNFDKLRNAELVLLHKILKNENAREAVATLTANDGKYYLKSELVQKDENHLFQTTAKTPSGETGLMSTVQKLGPTEYKGEWKVITPQGFAVADAHVDLNSVDDFMINANFDSDKIARRKLHAEIANKPTAKTGKRIVITITSDGQNIVTGSTSYKKRDEEGKVVVEGNGSLKVGDNTRSSSFKYTRQQLTNKKDGEVGTAIVLNANFGPSAIVGELKLSNKEIHVFESYCEQNKDCAHFKLQSILDTANPSALKHQITVQVDLKKFNVPAEFGLKTITEVKAPAFDHTTNLYLHTTKDKSEYTYVAYIHPKESASILTLPSRELAVVLTYDLPKTKHTGACRLDLSVFLDRKNKPSDKTSLSASGDITVDKNSFSLNGETKFTYPTQPKDMSVKGWLHYGGESLLDANLDIDVFAKKLQKISISANVKRSQLPDGSNITSAIEVNSRGQHLKVDLKSHATVTSKEVGFGSFLTYNDVHQKPKSLGVLFSATPSQVNLLATLPDKELIKDQWKMTFSKDLQKVDRELSLLGESPDVITFEAKDLNRFKFNKYKKDKRNDQLTVNGRMVIGQLVEVHADVSKDNVKKDLFHVLVHLDEKQFLKPDFGYNKENVAEAVGAIRNENMERLKKLKDIQGYVVEQLQVEFGDLVEHLKKAQPNLKPLMEYYKGELNKLEKEISADETVQEIQATLNKYFGVVVAAVTQAMKDVTEGLTKLQKQLLEILSNLKEAMKPVYAQLKESWDKMFHHFMEIIDAAAKLATTYLNAILNMINEHQKEFQDVLNVASEVLRDFGEVLSKTLERVSRSIEEFYNLLMNQLKALPIYEMAKQRFEELKHFEMPESMLVPIKELCIATKNFMSTKELVDFVETVCNFIVMHAKREKVDEIAELKKIYTQALAAVRSVVGMVQSQVTLHNLLDVIQIPQEIDYSLLTKLPGISSFRFSVWNLLRNRELPMPLDVYHAYRPTNYLSDIVPPFSKSAVVVDGGHFFTFDGRHLTMPGTCTYILAQDMQDGNFSVVANFNDGVLNSVTVTEPKESITLKNNGNILVNNKPADFPASTKNLHAYLVQPFANVKSDYGVRVTCSNSGPMICAVHVSGFYLGKLRGILGDGNNEPYDDFTLPSGKITESATEFGNAYKLKGDCPAATSVDHKQRAPICTEYFTGQNSPLRSCFDYVNPAKYRDGCDHAVAANTQDGACLIAAAYHYSCYAAGLKSTHVPSSCTSCKVGENKISAGDSFSVKTPKKEADIVFVVEQDTMNEKVFKDLITPMMSELRGELEQRGITDVHIGLIGYSEQMKWPQHYTVNGDTNINGEVKNMKFFESKPKLTIDEAKEGNLTDRLTYLGQRLQVEMGNTKLNDAYLEAVGYSYRPSAATVVVSVLATPCEKSAFPISLQYLKVLKGLKLYRDLGLTYFYMYFPKELLVSGKPQKNVVGYDADSVYTFADSKKKPLSGSSDMKENLATVADVCVDFAVSTGGAAFDLENFVEAKPNQKKQFIQVATKRIANGLTKVELEKDCSCGYKFGIIGSPECKIVGRKDREPAKKEGVKT
ncbi:apolipophorins isoform X2 [Hylaeus anthracinus]|uniref:apolipophorins isoform X2 n=1 Tax=Hylaeus anthracinus TaxID=313031 RepID=UPI0023B933A6|nr:apolipophorins isoform X2 [Hylaeus anthracinus]